MSEKRLIRWKPKILNKIFINSRIRLEFRSVYFVSTPWIIIKKRIGWPDATCIRKSLKWAKNGEFAKNLKFFDKILIHSRNLLGFRSVFFVLTPWIIIKKQIGWPGAASIHKSRKWAKNGYFAENQKFFNRILIHSRNCSGYSSVFFVSTPWIIIKKQIGWPGAASIGKSRKWAKNG